MCVWRGGGGGGREWVNILGVGDFEGFPRSVMGWGNFHFIESRAIDILPSDIKFFYFSASKKT